jgi:hypothetical protein
MDAAKVKAVGLLISAVMQRSSAGLSMCYLLIGIDVLDRPTCSLQGVEWELCIRGAS